MRTVIKGKADPVWFIEEVLHQKLFPKQAEIIREFYKSRYDPTAEQYKTLIVLAGMRSGKTAMASMMAVYEFFDVITMEDPAAHYGLLKNQPIFITVVATSEKLAEDGVFTNMANYITNCEWLTKWFDIKITGGRIECPAKHVIAQVLGSWVTTAVGRSNRLVVFDEMDLFEDTAGKRGSWELWSRLGNSTATFGLDGHRLAISSPKSASGIMMTLFKQGKKAPNTLSYLLPTWEMNPNLTKQDLMDTHKYQMHAFWRDFACQPEMAGGMQFPEGIKLTPMINVLRSNIIPKEPASRVLAIDPAVKNDAFGIACGYRDRLGNIVVDGVHKFTKEEGDAYILPSDIEKFIYSCVPRLNINYLIYDVWMFPSIIEQMQVRYGIVGEKHIVRKEDYDRWRGLQENPTDIKLLIVDDEDLRFEAEALIVKSENTQLPKTDHTYGGTKDIADCVANVIWYLAGKEVMLEVPDMVCIRAF